MILKYDTTEIIIIATCLMGQKTFVLKGSI